MSCSADGIGDQRKEPGRTAVNEPEGLPALFSPLPEIHPLIHNICRSYTRLQQPSVKWYRTSALSHCCHNVTREIHDCLCQGPVKADRIPPMPCSWII